MSAAGLDADALDVVEEPFELAARTVRLLRPARPAELHDPDAEAGAAGPVWARVWRSGAALAGVVAAEQLDGRRVVELGCGLGVVSLAAAAMGARVLASDRSAWALAFATTSAERSGLALDALRCDWRRPEPLLERGPFDLVLGADVLYDEGAAGALLRMLGELVAPGGEAWIADPRRATARSFVAAARLDWRVETVAAGLGVSLYRLRSH